MTKLKFITIFLLIEIYSCGQKPAGHKTDPLAVQLNKQAMALLPYIDNDDSSKKAISLLDKATEIDSNYFIGYTNKLMFYYQLKEFDKALLINDKLIQLHPGAHDLYLRSGILSYLLNDTTAADKYFTKSLLICNSVLDTMQTNNRDYIMIVTNKAINLVMLGDDAQANQILKSLYQIQTGNTEFDNTEKEFIASLMNKSKTELIDILTNPEKYNR